MKYGKDIGKTLPLLPVFQA